MRILIAILAVSLADSAGAQETGDRTEAPGVALGVVIAPAWEFSPLWLMPAIRVSVPLGRRLGVDLDAGRILGGRDDYGDIDRFFAGQVRFIRRPSSTDTGTQYWLLGLRYLDMWKIDRRGNQIHDPDTPFTIGVGGTHDLRPGAQFVSEFGFSGGRGYLLYINLGVQWELRARARTP